MSTKKFQLKDYATKSALIIAMLSTGKFSDDDIAVVAETTKKSVQSVKCRKGGGSTWAQLAKTAKSAEAILSQFGIEIAEAKTVKTLELKNGKTVIFEDANMTIKEGDQKLYVGEYSDVQLMMNIK